MLTTRNLIYCSFIFFFLSSHSYSQCDFADWTALKAFYQSTRTAGNWTDESGWSLVDQPTHPGTCDLSTMKGISLDLDGRVTKIQLINNELNGTLPPEMELLDYLVTIRIPNNTVGGTIPVELWEIPSINEIDFRDNDFTGVLPPEIGLATSLMELDLGNNNLSGEIPIQIGMLTFLKELSLADNDLTGHIPVQIGMLVNLEILNLIFNDLTGPIPSTIGMLINLERLYLRNNMLVGPMPKELANLTNLQLLLIDDNELSGCFHPDLISLCALGFNDSSITGGNNFDVSWSDFCNALLGVCDTSPCTETGQINYTSEEGNIYITNSCHGIIMTSPDGNCYQIKVDFGGELTTEVVTCP